MVKIKLQLITRNLKIKKKKNALAKYCWKFAWVKYAKWVGYDKPYDVYLKSYSSYGLLTGSGKFILENNINITFRSRHIYRYEVYNRKPRNMKVETVNRLLKENPKLLNLRENNMDLV